MVIREQIDELDKEQLYDVRELVFEKLEEIAEFAVKNRIKTCIKPPYCAYMKNQMLQNYIKDNNIICPSYESDYPINKKNYLQLTDIPKQMEIACASPWSFARIEANGNVFYVISIR